ncbi:MAG TPA: hypothetical protein VFL55_23855 [Acetobacteraceae bacterium]|nr:hypothetical protein [Acetobacteraceae bacterium]
MSATHVLNCARASQPLRVADAFGWLVERAWRLLWRERLLSGGNETIPESLITSHGPVEIHQTPRLWSLETCVKGIPDQARATGLRRLEHYASSRRLRIARPLVQAELAAGRWRLGVALPHISDDAAIAIARNGRVRLRELEAQALAVIRVPGRPTKLAMQHAETAIRLALGLTRWMPTGPPALRLYRLPRALPFLSRFEVVVPVTERVQQAHRTDWICPEPSAPRMLEAATPVTPVTR